MEDQTKIPFSYKFPKAEKLSSKKKIDALFQEGASFYLYPFTVRFLCQAEEAESHQFLISVSKRNYKRAVDRNRIKRLLREAIRLQKPHHLPSTINRKYYSIAYLYTAKKIHDYKFIEKKLISSLKRLALEIEKIE